MEMMTEPVPQKNCDDDVAGDYDGRGDSNTGARGVSTKWLRFLFLIALMEALGDMEKAKIPSSKKLRKKEVEKR